MKITNNYNMPNSFVLSVQKEFEYKQGHFRVTDMSKGIRECILFRRHHEEVTVDVSDMVWSLFGTAVHNILSNTAGLPEELREQEITLKFDIDGKDVYITGHFDHLDIDTLTMTDYKTASVYKVIFDDWKDAIQQIKNYAAILAKGYNIFVEHGRIVAFLKDHSKSKARYDSNYPATAAHKVEFAITRDDLYNAYLTMYNKVATLSECELLPDNELPMCTDEERWAEPTKYAVKKPGRKSAIKVCATYEDANAYIRANDVKGGFVEIREGKDKKCPDYCMAREFCSYWQEKYSTNGGETDGEE